MNVFKQLYSKLLWRKMGFKMAFLLHENASAPTKIVDRMLRPFVRGTHVTSRLGIVYAVRCLRHEKWPEHAEVSAGGSVKQIT